MRYTIEFDVWEDTKIKAGEKWEEAISKALHEATIAILLVSTNFLSSDFIRDNELPPLLASAQEDGVKIMSLIIHPCMFTQYKELSQFQAVNSPSEAISGKSFHDQEKILVNLCHQIQSWISEK